MGYVLNSSKMFDSFCDNLDYCAKVSRGSVEIGMSACMTSAVGPSHWLPEAEYLSQAHGSRGPKIRCRGVYGIRAACVVFPTFSALPSGPREPRSKSPLASTLPPIDEYYRMEAAHSLVELFEEHVGFTREVRTGYTDNKC